MRKIDKDMSAAVKERRYLKSGNTEVNVRLDMYGHEHIEVRLHGNMIWRWNKAEDMTEFTLAGWDTLTTRTRLRSLGVCIERRGGNSYFNGIILDEDEWYEIRNGKLV